jgi:hypothetical protein
MPVRRAQQYCLGIKACFPIDREITMEADVYLKNDGINNNDKLSRTTTGLNRIQ